MSLRHFIQHKCTNAAIIINRNRLEMQTAQTKMQFCTYGLFSASLIFFFSLFLLFVFHCATACVFHAAPDEKKWHKKETIFLNIKSVNEEPKTITKLTERTGEREKQNEGEREIERERE